MANEVLVGLKIGAAVSGTLHAAFGSARSTVQQLGRATEGLTAKQTQMGNALAESVARGGAGIGRLRRQYDQVGRTIDQLKAKQDRLNTSIARGETLKAQRGELRGQAMETMGTAAVLGAPIVQGLRTSIDFQDQLRDIRITAGFDAAEETELARMIRGVALNKNQTQTDVNAGVGTLVAGGLGELKALKEYVPIMAEVATATKASMEDLGASTIALRDSMKITGEDYKEVMNMLAAGGKAGQFELVDMAKWLPNLAAQYGAMGQTGKSAVAELTAALQVARMGAGNSDEAANNYKNFLSKLSSPDTIKSFNDAGIDLQESMRDMAAAGLSPVKSMLNIVGSYLGDKGPEAAAKYKAALNLKDETEREMAVQRLDEAYKLGELFRDQQVLAFLRPALANRDKMVSIEKEATAAANQDVIGADFALRMDTSGSSVTAFRIGLSELGIALGDGLLPAVNELLKSAIPLVRQFATWTGENPVLVKSVIGLVGGLLAGKLAFIGLQYGINLAISPLVAMTTTITGMSAKWTLLRGMWQAGRFVPFISTMAKVGGVVSWVGRAAFNDLRSGIRLAGQAVLWLGRALLMNPIGLAITAIALGAYLIYRYWEPIKGFFSGMWAEVKAGFNGGLSGIATTLLNFSPLGLFYRAFATTMSYFGIELPSRFSEFGGMLVSGLVNGITSTLGSARDAVVGMGSSVKGWFTETLGIHSPSRVFMGYGANLSEGAAIGITARSGLVRKAALGMAAATAVSLAPPDMATVSRVAGMQGGGMGAPMTIHFSPTINVPAGGDMQAAVQQGVRMSFQEFERLMDDYTRSRSRRNYGEV